MKLPIRDARIYAHKGQYSFDTVIGWIYWNGPGLDVDLPGGGWGHGGRRYYWIGINNAGEANTVKEARELILIDIDLRGQP